MPDFTVGLLVVIVIILVYIIMVRPRAVTDGKTSAYDCVNRATGEISSVAMTLSAGAATPPASAAPAVSAASPQNALEKKATAENFEHFESCANGPKIMPDLDSLCRGDAFEYAVNEYGGPGMGFKDWAASQAVDASTVQNHAAFVKDRTDVVGNGIITGRTWAMPDHESYQPTPWVGIRGRPTRVPVCNPTKVTDDDIYWFPTAQKVVWRSG